MILQTNAQNDSYIKSLALRYFMFLRALLWIFLTAIELVHISSATEHSRMNPNHSNKLKFL